MLVGSPLTIGLWLFAITGCPAPLIVGRFLRPDIARNNTEGADPD